MRRTLIPFAGLAVIAGTAFAQWHHFGDSAPDTKPAASISADMLAAHNAVRARVGVGPLAWSDQLAAFAQDWANGLAAKSALVHSQNPNYGENLYDISGALATPADVVNAWAGEVKDYNYAANTCRGVCGHYTQIVWKDTKEVGCASAKNGPRQVWVCEYGPPGNYIGRKPY